MRLSWRVTMVAGIPIYLHSTFAVLVVFLLISGLSQGRGILGAISSVLFVLAIFATIVLHELGHALTARRFGIKTRDITLLPIGGLARLERMPDVPRQELWVALAGPAVNIVLAVICVLGYIAVTGDPPELTLDPAATNVVGRFAAVNIALVFFNLVPAFPMDGGRALRALMAERIDYLRATTIAARIGQGLALVFGLLGLFSNPWLVFIALFVWMGASSELSMVSMRGVFVGVPISRVMSRDFRSVSADDSLQEAVVCLLEDAQRDFPVVDAGRIVGILTRDRLVAALSDGDHARPVHDVMTIEFETVDVLERLDAALVQLQNAPSNVLPVLREGRLVGLLTLDSISDSFA